MRRYLIRRLGQMIPTFLGITLLTFVLAQLAPGDPFALALEVPAGSDALAQSRRATHGLDAPVPTQFARWVFRVVRFDFGRSFVDERPVAQKLAEAAPRTALVASLALAFGFGVAVPLGVVLATHKRRWWARGLSALLLVAWSVPNFWVAVMLITVLSSPAYFDSSVGQGLALPVLCLGWPTLIVATRHVREAMIESLAQDYVRAARARGIPERQVIWRHALPNSLLPVVTMLGLHLPHLVGGSVVIERIFGIPGMGLLAFEAIGTRDYPTVMGVATVMALATMLSMLLVDVSYAALDPRIRLEDAA